MKIEVKNWGNEKVREVELPEAIFDYPYKEHLIHEVTQAILAAQRRGTHQAKTRAEVSGSGRKLWRQKGTGRARVGDIRNPKWRKGGITHGPRPRSYETRISVKEKKNALKSALSRRFALDGLLVVENFELDSHKTKDLVGRLTKLGIEGKALLVDTRGNDNLGLASRNHPQWKTVDALAVNAYDVVDRSFVVMSAAALDRLVEVLSK